MPGTFKDARNFASKMTLRKIWNGLLILGSYYLARVLARPVIKGFPVSISIEPTTSCNLRCPECPSGLRSFTRDTGMLNESLFRKTIDEMRHTLVWLTFYFQGEPYLNPAFLKMVRYASDLGIYTATSTNAHYLTEETARETVASGLDRLVISIDGTTQETYESYRVGGSLAKVLDGAARMVRVRKEMNSCTPHLIFQFLVVRQNEHEVPAVFELAKRIGIDEVVIKTAQIYDFQAGSPLIPLNEKYSRYRKGGDGVYSIKNQLLNHCWKMWQGCVITWDGKVLPCCFDKDAHFTMGRVGETPFAAIWRSEGYRRFRKSLLSSRKKIEMCRNCTEGTQVWA